MPSGPSDPGTHYIEISSKQASISFFVGFSGNVLPSPQLVHAGGFCIIDNLGGIIGAPYFATTPIHALTTDPQTGEEEVERIFFEPIDPEELESIPE